MGHLEDPSESATIGVEAYISEDYARAERDKLWRKLCLVVAGLQLSCTAILGIDEEYRPRRLNTEAGRAGTGGANATGFGGTGALGDAAEACPNGQKRCSSLCVSPTPIVGCSPTTCEPCPPPPPNSVAICNGELCSIECNDGFVDVRGLCEPVRSDGGGGVGGGMGSGGAPATGGAADGGPNCDASACPGCGLPGPIGCCRFNDTCGCTFIPGGYCL
jgi:hypothetical protein